MHTQCPSCLTIFRVGAAQLAEGRGQVRCGHCRSAFAALDTLADVLPEAHQPSLRLHSPASKPIELSQVSRAALAPNAALFAPLPPVPAKPTVIESGYGDLTEVFADEHEPEMPQATTEVVDPGPVSPPADATGLRFDENGWPVADSPNPASERPPVRAPFAEPPRTHRDSHRPLDRIAARHAHRAAIDPAPPAFARRRGHRARTGGGWGWWVGSAFLLAGLAAQLAWAARTQIMDVAMLRPWLLRACETLQCPLPATPATDSIALAARDVRPHPSVDSALIIGATLVNEADYSQPFPVIEITLADVNENRIGMRRFQPNEYVSDRRTLQRGIPPAGSALFSVEVEDPGKRAVAFEFRFL